MLLSRSQAPLLGGLFRFPFQPPGEKSKAEVGRLLKSSDAFDTSHPHFVLAPPPSVLRRGLEAASCLVRKAPSFLRESLEDV